MFLQGLVNNMKPELRKQIKFIYFKIHNSTLVDEQDAELDTLYTRKRESLADLNQLSTPVHKVNQGSG